MVPIKWEAHTCLPLHPDASFAPVERFRQAGVSYVSLNIGMDLNPISQVMATIAGFRATIQAQSDRYVLVDSVAQIEAAQQQGKLAIGFDLEGAMPLQERPEMVEVLGALGVRQMHFAYNRNNSVADGCHDQERGLTQLGVRMVEAVNKAGILMDCSHTGRKCSLDIMEASSAPVIFSHANPLSLVEHGRNITDEQIRKSAATGGVICISGVSWFLGCENQPTADDLARHAAYVADLVGAEHVGIGMDASFPQKDLRDDPPPPYDPDYWWPKSAGYQRGIKRATYPQPEDWLHLDAALQRKGFSAADASLVMGGNMARVARQVWGKGN